MKFKTKKADCPQPAFFVATFWSKNRLMVKEANFDIGITQRNRACLSLSKNYYLYAHMIRFVW